MKTFCTFLMIFIGINCPLSHAQKLPFHPNRVIVHFKDLGSIESLKLLERQYCDSLVEKQTSLNNEIWHFKPGEIYGGICFEDIESYVGHLNLSSLNLDIEIQLDFLYGVEGIPDDSLFHRQWNLHNSGQNGGIPQVDINALAAWEKQRKAPNVVMGILDTGIDWSHPDLVNRIWQNPDEVDHNGDGFLLWNGSRWVLDSTDIDGVDDDNNGYTDDLIGWDFVNNDNNPYDDAGHGTHVSGIIGATPDNGIGIAGICWEVQLMPLKFLDETGVGLSSHAQEALEYARQKGAHITNNSWGGGAYDPGLYNQIAACQATGQIFVAAAGNNAQNNDFSSFYPANYDLGNIISVGAHTCKDRITPYSNFGRFKVDIFAPGGSQQIAIMSTEPEGKYWYRMGTSMAAPHVAAALALIIEKYPNESYTQWKGRLLGNAQTAQAYSGKCSSGGRLDLQSMLLKESEQENGDQAILHTGAQGQVSGVAETDTELFFVGEGLGVVIVDKTSLDVSLFNSSNSATIEYENMVAIMKTPQDKVITGYSRYGEQLVEFENGQWDSLEASIQNVKSFASQGDSIIWVGTEGKLIKLDSSLSILSSYDTILPPTIEILTIQPISDSIILIGGLAADGLIVFNAYQEKIDTVFNVSNSGMQHPTIFDIHQAANGRVYFAGYVFGTADRIYEYVGDSIMVHEIPNAINTNHEHHSLSEDKSGNIWISDRYVGLLKFNPQSGFTNVPIIPNGGGILDLVYVDSTDRVWVFNSGQLLFSDDYQTWIEVPLNDTHLLYGDILDVEASKNGDLLVATTEGYFSLAPNSNEFSSKAWFPIQEHGISSIVSEDSNTIWVSSIDQNGIYQILNDTISSSFAYPLLPNGTTIGPTSSLELVMGFDSLIFCPNSHRLDILDIKNHTWSNIDTLYWQGDTIDIYNLYDISVHDSIIYLPCRDLENLQNLIVRFTNTATNGIRLDTIFIAFNALTFIDLAIGSNGVVWLAGDNRIYKIKNDSLHSLPNSLISSNYRAVAIDKNDDPWFGTFHGRVIQVLNDTTIKFWDSENLGIPKQQIPNSEITLNFDDNNLWVGVNNNLYLFNPEASASFTAATFTPCLGDTLLFTNQTKQADSYIWAINDSIVSQGLNLQYLFNSVGKFKVSLTAVDSVLGTRIFSQYFTVSEPFEISSLPDSQIFRVSNKIILPEEEAESYLWTFENGDTLSYEKAVLANASGTYSLSAIGECGDQVQASTHITFTGENWMRPGDVNGDGVINVLDFVHLGLIHGRQVQIRDSLTIEPVEIPAPSNTDFIKGIRVVIGDAFPDGLIDFLTDGVVIRNNKEHTFSEDNLAYAPLSIEIEFQQQSVPLGDTIYFDILLNGTPTEIANFMSLAMSIDLNVELSNEPNLELANSDLGQSQQNLFSGLMNFPDLRRIDIAVVRIDTLPLSNSNSSVLVATGGLLVLLEDIDDPISLGNRFLNIQFGNALIITQTGDTLQLQETSSSQTETVEITLPRTQLDAYAVLEGAFSGSGDSMNVTLSELDLLPISPNSSSNVFYPLDTLKQWVDWIWLALYADDNGSIGDEVCSRPGLLTSHGQIVDPFTFGPLEMPARSDSYYVAVFHRNHLPIVSRNTIWLSDNSKTTYDFRDQQTKAKGYQPMAEVAPSLFAMYAGDANADSIIQPSDKVEGVIPAFSKQGYLPEDLNLDGVVDSLDLEIYRKNVIRTTQF